MGKYTNYQDNAKTTIINKKKREVFTPRLPQNQHDY